MATYYVDPDWAGTKSGTQAEPWAVLNWTTINAALAGEDVTVYFSAREAGSDTAEDYGTYINIESKTADPGYTLTLDGNSYYNTDDETPSWTAYTGTNRCIVQYVVSQNSSHVKYNDVTVRGFKIYRNSGGKAVSIAGDNWLVDDCDVSHGASANDGPLINIIPTADSDHEGSSAYTPACDNITIQDCVIHDSCGELIYVGGGGSEPATEYPGSGYPAHTNITISGNIIYNGGVYGGQGDGIDVKGGIYNLTITGNEIYNLTDAESRAIVLQGEIADTDQVILIEKNYIHDCANWYQAISLSNNWGGANGVTIRNNIIDTVDGEGIVVYTGDYTSKNIYIYNNTVYGCELHGIRVDSGNTVTVKNNVCYHNNSDGAQNTANGTMTQNNNAHNGTWAGTSTGNVSGIDAADFTNAASGDFTIPSDSALVDVGETIGTFSDDYAGGTRPSGAAWDIGAYEYEDTSFHRNRMRIF